MAEVMEMPLGAAQKGVQLKGRAQIFLAQVPAYVWLIVLVVLPNILLLLTSFQQTSSLALTLDFTAKNYVRAFSSTGFWWLLGKTLLTGGLATLFATLIAYPMAYYAARSLRRGKFLAVVLVIIPLWISLLMRIFAWRVILGEKGVLNSFLLQLGIIDHPSGAFLYNTFSVFLTLVYLCIPFIFIAVYAAIERIPHSLIEASLDCGASKFNAFRTVVWPLSKPGTAIGISLAFLMTVGDYVTPSMVGGLNGTMLGVAIASQFGIAGNWPYGATLAIILMVFVAVILGILLAFCRVPGVLVNEGADSPPPPSGNGSKAKAALGFLVFCLPYLFLYAPLAIIALFSFNTNTVQVFPMQGFTFHWYQDMVSNAGLVTAFQRSLYVGLGVLVVSVVAGTGFAILFAYGRVAGSRLVEQLLSLPVAIPGVVLGITLVLVFQLLNVPVGIPRVVLGHCTFVMPVVMLTVLSRLRRLDPGLVEASLDLGASRPKTLVNVILPLVKGSIVGGALLGFTLSFDEVIVTQFLTGTQPTLPVWVWNQMRFGFTPSVNAIFVCIGVASILLTIMARQVIEERK